MTTLPLLLLVEKHELPEKTDPVSLYRVAKIDLHDLKSDVNSEV